MKTEEFDPKLFLLYRSKVRKGEEPATNDYQALDLRDRIILSNMYLCRRVVGKMKKTMPAHVERDDLESLAKIGLMQAVTRYDATLGVPFEAFATQRMRSVIMDGIRDADWAPRSLRKKHRDIVRFEEKFRQETGESPTNDRIATELGVTTNEISDTKYQAEIATHAYIEGSPEAQNKPISLDDDEDELVSLLKVVVAKALSGLSVRKAAIISLHYYAEKKLYDIAQILNMSEVRVGQLHGEAVLEIWAAVQDALRNDD